MRLELKRNNHNDTCFQYNLRSYYTEDENIILDYLEAYADESIDIRQWIEENLKNMICEGNNMSLGYNADECLHTDYYISFTNDIGIKHYYNC